MSITIFGSSASHLELHELFGRTLRISQHTIPVLSKAPPHYALQRLISNDLMALPLSGHTCITPASGIRGEKPFRLSHFLTSIRHSPLKSMLPYSSALLWLYFSRVPIEEASGETQRSNLHRRNAWTFYAVLTICQEYQRQVFDAPVGSHCPSQAHFHQSFA